MSHKIRVWENLITLCWGKKRNFCKTLKIIKFYLQTCWFVHTISGTIWCINMSIYRSLAHTAALYLLCKFMAKIFFLTNTHTHAKNGNMNFCMLHFFTKRVRERRAKNINSIICFLAVLKLFCESCCATRKNNNNINKRWW